MELPSLRAGKPGPLIVAAIRGTLFQRRVQQVCGGGTVTWTALWGPLPKDPFARPT